MFVTSVFTMLYNVSMYKPQIFPHFPWKGLEEVHDPFIRTISFPKSLDSAGHVIQDDFGHFVTHRYTDK